MALMGRKIAAIRAYVVEGGGADYHDQSAEHWIVKQIATPMSIYPEYKATRTSFGINALKTLVVEVEADNGVTGFGITTGGYPAAWLVMNHLDRFVVGKDANEIEKIWSGRARGVVPLGLSLRVVILRRLRLLLAGGLSCARLRPRSAVPANTVWRSTSWTRTVSVKRIGVPRRRRRTAAR